MYEELLPYAKTPRQTQILQMCHKTGSQRKAAKELNIGVRSVERHINAIKKHAADRHYAPEFGVNRPLSASERTNGRSELVKTEEGMVWYKSRPIKGQDELDAIQTAIEEMMDDCIGKSPKVKVPKVNNKDLLSVYCIGDAHLGMYAWGEETSRDFDVDIASRELKSAFKRLIDAAPPSEEALILNLGDFFHGDDSSNQTKQSGHALDIDTRHERVFRLGCNVMNYLVQETLKKHKKVIVRNVKGNHDDVTSMALKYQMDAYWRNNKRVINEMTPNPLWTYQFGDVALLATHGNAPKPKELPTVFAGHFPELWGATKFRYALHGHFHNDKTFSSPGCKVISFTNLAPNDSWHHHAGYLSTQEITLKVFHRNRGEYRTSIEIPEPPEVTNGRAA